MRITNLIDLPTPIADAAIEEFLRLYKKRSATLSNEEYAIKTMNANLRRGLMAFNYMNSSEIYGYSSVNRINFWYKIFREGEYSHFFEKFPPTPIEETIIDNVKYVL